MEINEPNRSENNRVLSKCKSGILIMGKLMAIDRSCQHDSQIWIDLIGQNYRQ